MTNIRQSYKVCGFLFFAMVPFLLTTCGSSAKVARSEPEVNEITQKASQGDKTSVQSLIETYRSKDVETNVRLAALRGLAESQDPAALQAMQDVLGELRAVDLRLYVETAKVLGRTGNQSNAAALVNAFDQSRKKWSELRNTLVSGIEQTASPQMIVPLIEAYEAAKQDYIAFEESMTKALGQFDDDQVVPILMVVAQDKELPLNIRNKAIDMLADKENPAIADLFVQMLQDPRTQIQMRDFALNASNEVNNADLLVALIESYNTGQQQYFALLDALTRAMQKFTDPQLKPALSEIAANRELPNNVRKQAIAAIGEYDDPALYENLITLMQDPENYFFYEQIYAIIHRQGTTEQLERLRRATYEAHTTQQERWRNE
ncbi:MAG: hypothetical protein MAGBODY4_01070 [Candidatus Marinimicrobia bacterium]|nr:hypothetical protein [Candidatus Neomarinimicrobiota bacterium]